jgi:hypothetical protein
MHILVVKTNEEDATQLIICIQHVHFIKIHITYCLIYYVEASLFMSAYTIGHKIKRVRLCALHAKHDPQHWDFTVSRSTSTWSKIER